MLYIYIDSEVVYIADERCAPGEIARGCAARPPLRSGPSSRRARQRPTRRDRRVVELALLSVGGSNCGHKAIGCNLRSWELQIFWRARTDSNRRPPGSKLAAVSKLEFCRL